MASRSTQPVWTSSCHREAAWQTVVSKESVPINPDEAGHANIYPEGGGHFVAAQWKGNWFPLIFQSLGKDNLSIVLLKMVSKWIRGASYSLDKLAEDRGIATEANWLSGLQLSMPAIRIQRRAKNQLLRLVLASWHIAAMPFSNISEHCLSSLC